MFKKFGGTLRDCQKVEDIIVADDVTIKTNNSTYQAKSIIISAGMGLTLIIIITIIIIIIYSPLWISPGTVQYTTK